MPLFSDELPDFPWDSLVRVRERAAEYPGGAVDLTIGTPVDPVPARFKKPSARQAMHPVILPRLVPPSFVRLSRIG